MPRLRNPRFSVSPFFLSLRAWRSALWAGFLAISISLTAHTGHSQTLSPPATDPGADIGKSSPATPGADAATAPTPAKSLAQACVALAATWIKDDPTLAKAGSRLNVLKALALAKQQDPQNTQAIIMQAQLQRGLIPSKPEWARPLPDLANELKSLLTQIPATPGQEPAHALLRARVLDLIVGANPSDEESILALAKAEESGPVDWKTLLPADATAAAASVPTTAPTPTTTAPAGKPAEFSKGRSVIKALFVTSATSGVSTGIAGNIILTHDKTAASPTVEATIGGGGTIGDQMRTAMDEAVRYINTQKPAGSQGARFTFGFEEKYAPKDGGSAGAAFALLMDSFFSSYEIAPDVAITGDISASGQILKVGGIAQKIDGAIASRSRMVMLPAVNRDAVSDIVVLRSPSVLTDIQIIAIDSLDTARKMARVDRDSDTNQSLVLFEEIKLIMARPGSAGVRDPDVQTKLAQINQLTPHHLSAHYLLAQSQGKLPRTLSLEGSINTLFEASGPVLEILLLKKIESYPRISATQYNAANKNLNALQFKIDPRTKNLHIELLKFLNQWQRMEKFDERDQKMWRNMIDEWLATRVRIGEFTASLTQDPEYIRKIVQGGE